MERVTDTHVFFWGGELSNWFECRYPYIRYKGITFFNSEQAFMWEKAIFFGDMEMAKRIVETPDPRENKALGRKVRGFDSERWLIAAYPIMVAVKISNLKELYLILKIKFLWKPVLMIKSGGLVLVGRMIIALTKQNGKV